MAPRIPPAELPVSARWIEALDRQATIIMAIFARAGFEPIAPPVIQPADVFLDLIGEELRARTYVFTDPNGSELCLRPDLTIPACRLYLARYGRDRAAARFAYNGVVFRYQPQGGDIARPREFRQAGIESFCADDPVKAEVEILALTVASVRASGLRAFRLRIGDLGVFNALLAAIDMPERWRARLAHHFWRTEAFRSQLARLVGPGQVGGGQTAELREAIAIAGGPGGVAALEQHLEAKGLTIAGTRTLGEVATQLADLAKDLAAPPLDRRAADLLEAYLKLSCPADQAAGQIRACLMGSGIDIETAIRAFETRLTMAGEEGIDLTQATFAAGFGRAFEYYTGFVFEVLSPVLDDATPMGGGGRYDTLVHAISGTQSVPAVGAALHTERLLLAVRGGRP